MIRTVLGIVATVMALGSYIPYFKDIFAGKTKPQEETLSTFALSALKFVIAIIALENLTLTTWLYPASLVAMNGAFVILLLVRRKQVGYVEVRT